MLLGKSMGLHRICALDCDRNIDRVDMSITVVWIEELGTSQSHSPHACLSAMNTLMCDGGSGDANQDTVYNLSKNSLNYRSDNGCGSYRIAIGY